MEIEPTPAEAEMVEGKIETDVTTTPTEPEETGIETKDVKSEIDEATQNIIDSAEGDPAKLAKRIRDKDTEYNKVRQEATKAQDALYSQTKRTVEESPYYLLDLYKEDPETAEKISQEIWNLPYNQIEEQMFKKKDEDKAPEVDELVKRQVAKEMRDRDKKDEEKSLLANCEKEIAEFMTKNDIDPEVEKLVEEEYRFLAQGKDISPSTVRKLLAAAYASVTGNKSSIDESVIESAAMKARQPVARKSVGPKKTKRQKEIGGMFSQGQSSAFGY